MNPKTGTVVRTVVKRACTNYPMVVTDITKDLKYQAVELYKAYFKFLKLSLKAVGIITFPLWILPLACTMYITLRVMANSQNYAVSQRN